jgi:hypothetical protein
MAPLSFKLLVCRLVDQHKRFVRVCRLEGCKFFRRSRLHPSLDFDPDAFYQKVRCVMPVPKSKCFGLVLIGQLFRHEDSRNVGFPRTAHAMRNVGTAFLLPRLFTVVGMYSGIGTYTRAKEPALSILSREANEVRGSLKRFSAYLACELRRGDASSTAAFCRSMALNRAKHTFCAPAYVVEWSLKLDPTIRTSETSGRFGSDSVALRSIFAGTRTISNRLTAFHLLANVVRRLTEHYAALFTSQLSKLGGHVSDLLAGRGLVAPGAFTVLPGTLTLYPIHCQRTLDSIPRFGGAL